VDVTLAGFDYDLRVGGATLVRGDQASRQTFTASGRRTMEIPISLKFADLAAATKTLRNADSAAVTVALGLAFDVPVLGRMRVPAGFSGKLPVVRPPSVSIRSLRLKKTGLTRADLELALEVANPNAFALGLKRLDYDFLVNGLSWARSVSSDSMTVRAKSDGTLRIPVSLNLAEMGQAAVQLLSGNRSMDCRLEGSLDLDASLPGFKRSSLPLGLAEKIGLSK
jgi:LEA14-like dessication related protein